MRVLLLLGLLSSPAVAGEFGIELGLDVVHVKGVRLWSVFYENPKSRFSYGSFGQDDIEIEFYAAEYVWRWNRLSASAGIIHVERRTPINGTRINFLLGIRWALDKKEFMGGKHFSHGAGFGIEKEKSNLGGNFLTVGTRF